MVGNRISDDGGTDQERSKPRGEVLAASPPPICDWDVTGRWFIDVHCMNEHCGSRYSDDDSTLTIYRAVEIRRYHPTLCPNSTSLRSRA